MYYFIRTKKEIRAELMRLFKGFCYYCGRRCRNDYKPSRSRNNPRDMATIDHLIPIAKGGRDAIDNMVLSCHACNNEKGDIPAEEFKRRKSVK